MEAAGSRKDYVAQGRGVERNLTLALEYLRKAEAQH